MRYNYFKYTCKSHPSWLTTSKTTCLRLRDHHFVMDRWANKVAVVTGASSGIGEHICRELSSHQVIVVGLARRLDLLTAIAADIKEKNPSAGRFVGIACDVTVEDQVKSAFGRVVQEFGGVDILVNNAGIFHNACLLEEGCDEILTATIQTNLAAVVSCTRKAFKSMSDRNSEGYIVNISSIAGHVVPGPPSGMKPFPGAYFASKCALTALNKSVGQELVYYKKPFIRVSNISPGLVQTEIFKTGGFGEALEQIANLQPKDVTDALLYILSTPSHVQVRDIILEGVGNAFY